MLDSTTHIARALTELDEPFVRYKILLHIYNRSPDSREIRILRDEIRASILVRTLLAELDNTGQIPLAANQRWRGGHWVLYLLADLGSTSDDPSLYALRDQVCAWLCSPEREEPVNGAIEGNALYYLLFLELDNGCADSLAERLVKSLDKKIGKSPAAFAHALHALRGLTLHAQTRGVQSSRDAATGLAEHLLTHRLYQRSDGQPLSADSAALHYPCYAHCDPLFALKVLRETGDLGDERCRDALKLLKAKQLADGTFPAERKHYRVGRFEQGSDSLVDWGGYNKRKTNLHVTCDALAVLHAAGERF
jgi:hypothetical protein